MTRKFNSIISFITLTFFLIMGCQKVSDLDNQGLVTGFEIDVNTLTSGVILGSTPSNIVIQDNKNYIYINVNIGKHITPIEFDAKITINDKADKLLNLAVQSAVDSVYHLSFKQKNEPVTFYVVAQSGKPVEWEARLLFENLSDEAEITSFQFSQILNTNITHNPDINSIDKSIDIYAIDMALPLKLYPKITYSEESSSSYDGLGMEFTSYTSPYVLKVTSESGYVNNWNILLKKPTPIISGQEYSREQLSRMAINQYNIKPQGYDDSEPIIYAVDSTAASVSLYLDGSYLVQEKMVNLNLSPPSGALVAGQTSISFTQSNQTKYVYMIDKSLDQYRQWSIKSILLSDNTIIVEGATFDSYVAPEGIVVGKSSNVDSANKHITFTVNSQQSNTQITLNGLRAMVNPGTTSNLASSVTFKTLSDIERFEVSSPNGLQTEYWSIGLRGAVVGNQAELLDFDLGSTNIDWSRVYIEQQRKRITVEVNQKDNLLFTPQFQLSLGATISSESGTIHNQAASSATINTPIPFTVMSEDQQASQDWIIEFIYAPQLSNRSFDDELLNWGTANVLSPVKVIGTEIIDRADGDGFAAMCRTQEQDALLFGKLVAAGALFKGSFKMQLSINGLQYPRTMTKFGIPFDATQFPVSMELDSKYKAGAQMQQAVFNGSKFEISNRDGVDQGQIYIEMINYTDNGGDMALVPDSYSGFGKNGFGEPAQGVSVLSRANLVMSGNDTQYADWLNDQNISFESFNNSLPITHIVFVAASSISGDKYLGAIGSQLWVDNVVMTYYVAEQGAAVKKRE